MVKELAYKRTIFKPCKFEQLFLRTSFMKSLLLLSVFCFGFLLSSAQTKTTTVHTDSINKIQVVEAACGQCKFGLKGKGCNLAVRINGKAYFVDGTDIDSHGDAHADDGFCNAIRKAEVQGGIVKNRFKASYFRLLAEEKSN
jgi:hypothetical protein